MGLVPNSIDGKISFALNRASFWVADPTAVGLSLETAQAVETAAGQALDLRAAALQARTDAELATQTQDQAVESLMGVLSPALATIKAFAASSEDPQAVYNAAKIPAPTPPSPRPAPDMPTNVQCTLDNNGAVVLTWKGLRSDGVSFRIERAFTPLSGSPEVWSLLDTTYNDTYTDATVPVGKRSAMYRVKAMRGELSSDWTDGVQIMFGQPDESTSTMSLNAAA